jgi:hypothetical protein
VTPLHVVLPGGRAEYLAWIQAEPGRGMHDGQDESGQFAMSFILKSFLVHDMVQAVIYQRHVDLDVVIQQVPYVSIF